MLFASIGAICMITFLSKAHDNSIAGML
jgi:hypothetical protein